MRPNPAIDRSAELTPCRRVAVLLNPDNPACELQLKAAKAAAPAIGFEVNAVPVQKVQDIDHAFVPVVGRVQAVLVTDDVLLDGNRPGIAMAAVRNRLAS